MFIPVRVPGPTCIASTPVTLRTAPCRGLIERRHHRAEDRPFKAGGVDAVQAENIQQLDRILILHFWTGRWRSGIQKAARCFEHAERDIGIPPYRASEASDIRLSCYELPDPYPCAG